jgi:hypothetical protein
MPVKELFWKTVGFGLVTLTLVVVGIVLITGTYAANEGVQNQVVGWALIAFGAGVGLMGLLFIAVGFRDARLRREEHTLHITPRNGPPAPPPAWGMGDVGRPGSGIVAVGGADVRGGGTAKMVGLRISNLDVPLVLGYLLVWTFVGLVDPDWLWLLAGVTVLIAGPIITASMIRRDR